MPMNKLPRLRDPTTRDFVHQVRDMFLEEYKQNPDLYYEEDMRLVKEMKFLLQRCIISKKKNVKDSYAMLVAMCRWRKEQKLRELTDQDFPAEYCVVGASFLYEPDKFGNRTVYVRTGLVKTIPELKASFKLYMAYLMYKIDDCEDGKTWSVIFDLTNTGWNNYDIDLLMHFLTLLKEYFPVNVDYVLAINFPWILSAAWSLAKRLIPPERRDVVVFISNKEIFKYVDKENCPDFLSGTCKREHQFEPKTSYSTVDYLLSVEPEIPAKRIKEIIKQGYSDLLTEEYLKKLYKQIEDSGRS